MVPVRKTLSLLIFIMSLLFAAAIDAHQPDEATKTLSPYFFVKSDDDRVDALPLKSTKAEVNVVGVIADVVVTQVYRNEGKKPIEALYVFPASTRAAVYGMKMTLGERTIVATVKERDDARRTYEQAKEQGKSATLLEQQRPNVFQMNVANILPQDVVKVELRYTELLLPNDGIYEFVYPTVVGPRYSNQAASAVPVSEKWVENPYLRQGKEPTYPFDLKVSLAAGLPIQEIGCRFHKVNILYENTFRASVSLDSSEKSGGNRDFILNYQLAGKRIESGLLLYEGEKENFFLLMLQPPKRITTDQIPPREYIFIVDVSGSMYGFPLEVSKKLLRDLTGNLRPTDRFNVLLFSGGSSVLSGESVSASPENIRRALDLIDKQKGGGGTELLPALRRALSLPRSEGCSRTVVIATDGYVTVEEEVFDLIRNNLGDANMFTFGIGTAVNRHLLEGMARVGMGEPFVISRIEETSEKAQQFRKMIESPVLTNVKIDFGAFNTYDVEPIAVPDVFAERPIIVSGKWRGKPSGELTLRGLTGTLPYLQRIDIRKEKPLKSGSALRYLWARQRIGLLSDYNNLRNDPQRVKEVTSLGLAYNLLTAYTSFVAIDTQVRVEHGQAVTVKQPLPLPQGVSDYAVGGKGETAQKAALNSPVPRSESVLGRTDDLRQTSLEEKSKEREKDLKDREGSIKLGKVSISEEVNRRAFEREVSERTSALETCYQKLLNKGPEMKREVSLEVTLDSNGNVLSARVLSNQLKDSELEQCIIKMLKGKNFSSLKIKNKLTFTFSLIFDSSFSS